MASRFAATARLSNVIQMVTLSKQSGILRATRGHGPQRELGQIRFLAGEPVSALLGSLTGGTALSALSNWGECMYLFDEIAGDSDSSYPQQQQQQQQQQHSSPSFTPPSMPSGSWPSYGYPSSSSLNSLSPLPDFGSSGDVNTSAGFDNDATFSGYGYPGAQDPFAALGGLAGSAPAATATPQSPLRPEQLMSRPRRTSLSEQVDQLPLDRRERMVLLLVDGQRTVADLVRLTRRNDVELYAVLSHLRILGLVLL